MRILEYANATMLLAEPVCQPSLERLAAESWSSSCVCGGFSQMALNSMTLGADINVETSGTAANESMSTWAVAVESIRFRIATALSADSWASAEHSSSPWALKKPKHWKPTPGSCGQLNCSAKSPGSRALYRPVPGGMMHIVGADTSSGLIWTVMNRIGLPYQAACDYTRVAGNGINPISQSVDVMHISERSLWMKDDAICSGSLGTGPHTLSATPLLESDQC